MISTRLYEKSFQGRRHAERNTVCQDCCGHCVTPNGWVAAAAADGVSASPLAEIGAQIAVKSFLEYFRDFRYSPFLDESRIQEILCDAFNYALRRVEEYSPEEGNVPYAKYTTLHGFLYGKKIGLHWGQAGDGALFLLDGKGRARQLGEAMRQEDGLGPVTLQDGPEHWAFGSAETERAEAVMLVTDGLGAALLDSRKSPAVREAAFRMLMGAAETSESRKSRKEAADRGRPEAEDDYYSNLFFGEKESPAGGEAWLEKDADRKEALSLLRSVTDDITLLLIREVGAGQSAPSTGGDEKPEAWLSDSPSEEQKAEKEDGKEKRESAGIPGNTLFRLLGRFIHH